MAEGHQKVGNMPIDDKEYRAKAIKEFKDELALHMEEGGDGVAARIRANKINTAIDLLEAGYPVDEVISKFVVGDL